MPRKNAPSPANAGSGSPTGEPVVYLSVGFIRRPHGIHGELIMDIHTDFPDRLCAGAKVFLGEEHKPAKLASARPHGTSLLVSFRGLNSPEESGRLRNTWVYVTAADRPPLPEGKVYQYQLIGLRVVTDDGRELGSLIEILETGANNVYVVKAAGGKEILLPAIPDVILGIDLSDRVIRVHLLDGLET
jgi:16S rRNA processing protein RimM